jgi:hypothetical protein
MSIAQVRGDVLLMTNSVIAILSHALAWIRTYPGPLFTGPIDYY